MERQILSVPRGAVNGGASFPDVIFNGDGETGRVPVFGGDAPWGPAIDEFAPNDLFIEDKGLFASLLTNDFLINVTIEAAKENGLAKILAEPNLTVSSDQAVPYYYGPSADATIDITIEETGPVTSYYRITLAAAETLYNRSVHSLIGDLNAALRNALRIDGIGGACVWRN